MVVCGIFFSPLEFLAAIVTRKYRTHFISIFRIKQLSPRDIKQLARVFMAEIKDECRQSDSNILPLNNGGKQS